MKKFLRNAKSVTAYLIAFAVLAVSLFAGVVVSVSAETVGTCGRTVIEKWDKKSDGV